MPGEVSAMTAIVVATADGFALNLAGALAPAYFPAGYMPSAGDVVTVLRAEAMLYVLGPVSTTPRPVTGTVAGSASGGRVPVAVTVGPTPLSCRFVGTAPEVGALVRLDWQQTTPWIWPSAAAVEPTPVEPPPAPDTPPPPPPPTQSGTTTFPVVDSGTWQVGGRWGFRGNGVVQWRYGSAPENRGAWFLGTGPTQLRGRTITRFRLATGPRARIGSYNATLTAHFYLISNPTRPSGDTTRIAGPHDVQIAPNASPTVDLPTEFGQRLADSGGGIAIVGSPYLGFDPGGAAAILDWRR